MELVHTRTGTLWNRYIAGLVYNGTGTQRDWYTMDLVHNGTDTLWNRYTAGLVYMHSGTGI